MPKWEIITTPASETYLMHHCNGSTRDAVSIFHSDHCVACFEKPPTNLWKLRNFLNLSTYGVKDRFIKVRKLRHQTLEGIV